MMKLITFLIFILSFDLLGSERCENHKLLSVYKPKYAKGFEIFFFEGFKKVKIFENKDEFLILDKGVACKSELFQFKNEAFKVIMTSTTYLPSLADFNLEDRLVAFAGKRYIINEKIKKDKVKDLSYELSVENLMGLRPDVIIAYEANLKKQKIKNLRSQFHLPIFLNFDYKEVHPLARLEWSVVNALFWNKGREAIFLFNEKTKKYEALKEKYKSLKPKKILVGSVENSNWATPGELSDFGILIKDAGGELVLKSKSASTQFLSIESVIGKKQNIDVWLPHNDWKNKNIIKTDVRYKLFRDLKTFNNNKKINESGFNDFWEGAKNHPDLLLEDLHDLMHGKKNLIWYQELK